MDKTARRSTARVHVARALWTVKPETVEFRTQSLGPLRTDHARVRTLFSGISRGTERLVFTGAVPESEWPRMRAPMQEGQFPFPVKYGYCATGVVEVGAKELVGRAVFCLHPHQDIFDAPVSMLVPIPEGVPPRRATLAANVETALNALWDAGAGPGDRIVVIGAGVVGLCVAAVACGLPGADVTVVDVDASRRGIVESFGGRFEGVISPSPRARGEGRGEGPPLAPAAAPHASHAAPHASVAAPHPNPLPVEGRGEGMRDADIVFHTSASQAGLNVAIACAGMEGTIVELSWYGETAVTVGLGGAFHSRRLRLVSSQVGQVSPSRRARWTYRRRIEKALALLRDARFDALVADEIAFADAVKEFPRVLGVGAKGLAPVVKY